MSVTTSTLPTNSKVWAGCINQPGRIVERIDAINQRLAILISTSKGSHPLDPEFGIDIQRYIDNNSQQLTANLKKEIIKGCAAYLPEIKINKISFANGAGKLRIEISASYLDERGQTFGVSIPDIGGRNVIVLDRPNVTGYFSFSAAFNGVVPAITPGAFATMDALYSWAQANYGIYGMWGFADNTLMMCANDGITASIEMYTI